MINKKDIEKAKYEQDREDLPPVLKEIENQYTPEELKAIAKGGRIVPGQTKVPVVSFKGERIRIGVMSDTHFGSKYFVEKFFFQALDMFDKENVDFIVHCGDVTDGLSNRPDHIYELNYIGYNAQKDYAKKLLKDIKKKVYMIDGNHDRYYIKNGGAIIVRDICEELGDNFIFLGHDEGDISLDGNAILKIWHGIDGSSYAYSYRLQKLIESFTGGEKPDVLITGHVHKCLYIFCRHVHCYGAGALSTQSKFMRGKKLENHTGFWIIDLFVGKKGVSKVTHSWYPFYA